MIYEKLEGNLSILNTLFEARDEEIATITLKDKEELKETNSRLKQKESELKEIINENKNQARIILDLFYEYLELSNKKNAYYDQKYYKSGFKDAVGLLMICLNG